MSEVENQLSFLLNKRCNYIQKLQLVASKTNNYLGSSDSDDSESSYEECEPTENDTSDINIPVKNEQVKEHVKINIEHEIIDERMDFEESNDNDTGIEYDEHVSNKKVNTKNKDKQTKLNNQDDQTDVEINRLINIKEEKSSCSGKPTLKRRHRNPKKDSLKNEQTSKIKLRRPIKKKTVDYADVKLQGLNPTADIIDGVRRDLRPRKLNEPHIYFEPYDGSTSEGSDFTDLSD